MKRVVINAGTVGLVFKKGAYKRVLTEGNYWLRINEMVTIYNLAKPFSPPSELSILLKDERLKALLLIIDVNDSEIVLQYEDNIFKKVLESGRYAFWKGVVDFEFKKIDLNSKNIAQDIHRNVLLKPEVLKYLRVFQIEAFEEGLLFVDGKFETHLNAGVYYYWKNAEVVSVLKADMRQRQIEISGQEILTKDKAALRLNFYCQFKIEDIKKALLNNKEYEKQLYIVLQLALREFIGSFTLDNLLEQKDSISRDILSIIVEKARNLGVELLDCGIRDIILPGDVKDIMNQVLVAEKKAQANIVSRREETASTRNLLNTAKLMEENAMLFKLKEMEYIEKIADKINNISLSGGNLVVEQLKGFSLQLNKYKLIILKSYWEKKTYI
ncbi:MAG: slipin family protein [Bacteroidales bacterium]|nr:slipin family protein [Bacteroidales bacterium]